MLALAWTIFGARGVVVWAIKFFSSPFGRVVGVALIAGAIWVHGDLHGHRKERAACEAKAARAAELAKQIDAGIAGRRAARAERTVSALQAQAELDRLAINQLKATLATQPLQSTKAGALHDPNALLDDRCRLTAAGARWLRRYTGPPAARP